MRGSKKIHYVIITIFLIYTLQPIQINSTHPAGSQDFEIPQAYKEELKR